MNNENEKELKAIKSGSFELLGIEIKYHVLNNGQRVIEADSLKAIMNLMSEK